MKYCMKCGNPVKDEQAYCNQCGAPLNYSGKPQAPETKAADSAENTPAHDNPAETAEAGLSKTESTPVGCGAPGASDIHGVGPAPDTYAYANYNAVPINNAARSKNARGLAIASLVLGIISFLFCCCFPMEYIVAATICMTALGAAALVPGVSALKKGVHAGDRAMAIIGIILGGLTVLAGLISILLYTTGLYDRIEEYMNKFN